MAFVQVSTIAQTNDQNQSALIEIIGRRGEQALKIDRRTYRVGDNAHAEQSDTFQLLRGLPAVTITPDQHIMLLGNPQVRILVDERPVEGDALQYLRTLHGSDIERIEIITNPSAQYAAEGTGGIINIVLRKKRTDGLAGSTSGEGSSFGRAEGSGSFKYKKGKWTYEVQAQGTDGQTSHSTYSKFRSTREYAGAPLTVNTETGNGSTDLLNVRLGGKITRAIDDRTNVATQIFWGEFKTHSRTDVQFRGLTSDFASFDEERRSSEFATYRVLELLLDRAGKREGESLKGTLRFFQNPRVRQDFDAEESNGGSLRTSNPIRESAINLKLDWTHRIGKSIILTTGVQSDEIRTHRDYLFSDAASAAGISPVITNSFSAIQQTSAAYATIQVPIGTWTVMPGLRVDYYDQRIESPSHAATHRREPEAHPSLHVDQSFGKRWQLTLSYSNRIDRPYIGLLQPYDIVQDRVTILRGNPDLRDQQTDAFEANLHYRRGKLDAGMILYDRETGGLFSDRYTVAASGATVVTQINAGHKSDRGAEFDVNTPLLPRLKVTTSINLFDSRAPMDPLSGASSLATFRYSANTTLDWTGKQRHSVPGDTAQLQFIYDSPHRDYQVRYGGTYWLSASYTHNLSKTLSLTGMVDGIIPLRNNHVLDAPLVHETYDQRQRGPEVRIKLLKSFGSSH